MSSSSAYKTRFIKLSKSLFVLHITWYGTKQKNALQIGRVVFSCPVSIHWIN